VGNEGFGLSGGSLIMECVEKSSLARKYQAAVEALESLVQPRIRDEMLI
jgi:hypothetical protein